MAEVGVLDLQIHDNSAKAAEGLNSLASALERVRSAVGTGKQLSGVSKDIEKINAAVSGGSGGKASKSLGGIEKAVDSAKQAASGFVEVSSRIEESMSSVGDTMADTSKEINTYTASVKEAQKATEAIGGSTKKAWKTFNPATGGYDISPDIKGVKDIYASADRMREEGARVNEIKRQLSELRYGLENPAQMNYGDFLKQSMNIEGPVKSAKESMDVFLQAFENMDSMTEVEERIAELNPELQDLATNGESSKTVIQRLKEAFFGADSEVKSFKDAVTGMLPSLSAMAKQMESIARRMALRAVIKQVTAGFKEGISNLYQYSNAVGTSFAPAMDSAASTMLQFKNSIGAAVAPAIEALIPVLQTVVDWMITAINYVNQFLALISGKGGWTKAVPAAASAFDDASKKAKSAGGSAKKAAKDVKELLADWDELNIIQSQTGAGGGGGGGGGGAGAGLKADFSSMFEEVRGFDKEVQAFVKNLKSEFGSVLGFVTEIGAAILAWKVSSVFGGIIGTLAAIAGTAIALDLVIKTTGVFDKTFLDTGSEGWLIGSILTPVIGGVFAKQILSKVISGSAAKLAIPLMLTVSSVVDVVTLAGRTDVSALDKKSLELSVVSALKAGGAAAYFAHTLGGYSLGGSIAGGAAVAIATFGVAIGIKAIAQTVASGVTMENVKAAALASLAVGLGAGMFAKIAGATLASAAVFGGAAAAITVGTLAVGIGIAALINASKDDIKWGTEKLTEEQIEDFVNSEMFSIDVKTTAKIITDNVVAPSQQERAAMEESLSTMLGDWKIIKLGVAEKQDYETLQTDVNNLVTQIGTYIETAKKAGKLTIQFVPTLAGETEEEQASWLTDYTKGWKTVDDWATNTGKRLGELISKAETNSLKEGEPELLETLMGQMSRVTAAIARGKAGSEAFGNLIAGVGDISDIDESSFKGIIEKYKQYQTELRTSLTAQANEQLSMQGSLVAALYEIDPNGAEYKKAKADYEKMTANLVASIETSVKTYSSDGANWLLGVLRDKYAEYIPDIADGIDIDGYFASSFTKNAMEGKSSEELANYIDTWISNLVDRSNSELSSYLDSAGIANWNILETNVRESIRSAMEAALGPELTNEIIKLWEINNPVEEAISEAEEPQVETAATVDATVKENVSYETVGEATEAGKEAVGNLPASVGEELAATDTTISTHTFPATSSIDTSATTESARQMRDDVAAYVSDTIAALETLNSISGGFSYGGGGGFNGLPGVKMTTKATGGNIRSGEAFFANENGNIEMMGKMGNSTVVANNQQIVDGISRGVATSNAGMEAAMSMMVTLMRQFVNKKFTAQVVPSSSMGRSNAMSNEAYRKVTG